MDFMIEAGPELFIACVIAALIYALTSEKLSKKTRHKMLMVYGSGLLITVVLLYQSSTTPVKTLEVKPSIAAVKQELAEVKDLSPHPLTEEESTARLNNLIEKQRQDVSISQDD